MAVTSSRFPVPDACEILRARYVRRLPARLEDLQGPAHGMADLPLHVVWSGRRSFDVDDLRPRTGLYRTALAEGQQQDVVDFLNRDLPIAQWPVLRTLISRLARDVWEDAFPELPTARNAAAA
ncbi:hypothetical protein [Streptomyces sp. NPDC057910]|uniref:hypothetical protein n=1 Tax=Streptomyces sp. NPDC057910 TaxID=3346278 RepID=UPI0036E5E9EA